MTFLTFEKWPSSDKTSVGKGSYQELQGEFLWLVGIQLLINCFEILPSPDR
jgi:hypothetical protein